MKGSGRMKGEWEDEGRVGGQRESERMKGSGRTKGEWEDEGG